MDQGTELSQLAQLLPKEKKKEILMSFPEVKLHHHMRELFIAMQPGYEVEITHGVDELGKDLVIVKRDNIGQDVIAVIVKSGDIRAKTAGDVDEVVDRAEATLKFRGDKTLDEIESQIQQARSHPAVLKGLFAKLPVTKVLVVLAGEIGGRARTRLLKEMPGTVQVADVGWLIEKFTEFYPQVFFEGKVIDFLQHKIQTLEIQHYFSRQGKNLSDYFVDPPVEDMDAPIDLTGSKTGSRSKKRKLAFSELQAIVSTPNRLLVVGDPGTGKSIALAKLALDMLRKTYAMLTKGEVEGRKASIPVLVSAEGVLNSANLDDLLDQYFGSDEVRDRFEVCALMVDALDEVAPSQRESAISKTREYIRQMPHSALIMTSRKVDAVNATLEGFRRYEIRPFGLGQAYRLFERVVNNTKKVDVLRRGLERVQWQIPMVPLSLMLLIELVEQNQEIPASLSELYDRFSDMVLGRWDREKGIEVLFDYLVKKRFLGELAMEEFISKNRLEIGSSEYASFARKYATRFGWDPPEFDKFGKEIERAGVTSSGATVAFRHKSFLEYFGAFHIYDRREEIPNLIDLIVRLYYDGLWGDVSFFYVGLKREINMGILEQIFGYGGKDLPVLIQKLMTGRLLQAGWHSPTEMKSKGIEIAVSYVTGVREQFVDFLKRAKIDASKLVGDMFVMMLSEMAFSSAFLAKEGQTLFHTFASTSSKEDINKMVALLWANRKFLDASQLKAAVNEALKALEKTEGLAVEDEVRAIFVLSLIEEKDEVMTRALNRRVAKLKRRAPDVFQGLLPESKQGHRRGGLQVGA